MKKPLLFIAALLLCACAAQSPNSANAPKQIKMVRPAYPFYALSHHIEGFVKFAFDVDAEGKVSELRILQSEPRGLFEPYIIAAVSQWRYEKNKPAKNLKMTIRFALSRDADPARSTIIF